MSYNWSLPQLWYLKINEDNIDLIQKWRIEKFNNHDTIASFHSVGSTGLCDGYGNKPGTATIASKGVEITTEQFKKYVLDVFPNDIINEDLSYLGEFLTKLNIK